MTTRLRWPAWSSSRCSAARAVDSSPLGSPEPRTYSWVTPVSSSGVTRRCGEETVGIVAVKPPVECSGGGGVAGFERGEPFGQDVEVGNSRRSIIHLRPTFREAALHNSCAAALRRRPSSDIK